MTQDDINSLIEAVTKTPAYKDLQDRWSEILTHTTRLRSDLGTGLAKLPTTDFFTDPFEKIKSLPNFASINAMLAGGSFDADGVAEPVKNYTNLQSWLATELVAFKGEQSAAARNKLNGFMADLSKIETEFVRFGSGIQYPAMLKPENVNNAIDNYLPDFMLYFIEKSLESYDKWENIPNNMGFQA